MRQCVQKWEHRIRVRGYQDVWNYYYIWKSGQVLVNAKDGFDEACVGVWSGVHWGWSTGDWWGHGWRLRNWQHPNTSRISQQFLKGVMGHNIYQQDCQSKLLQLQTQTPGIPPIQWFWLPKTPHFHPPVQTQLLRVCRSVSGQYS